MKKVLVGLVVLVCIVVGLATFLKPQHAICSTCTGGGTCSFNTDCDVGCFCYKGSSSLNGVCASRD